MLLYHRSSHLVSNPADAQSLKSSLEKKESELVPLIENPVDKVWGTQRPARVKNKVFPLTEQYSGKLNVSPDVSSTESLR